MYDFAISDQVIFGGIEEDFHGVALAVSINQSMSTILQPF